MVEPSSPLETSRRDFLAATARTACAAGFFGTALGLWIGQARALPATALRPPGALAEDDFLGTCARCGLCVQDCPYKTLKLAEPGSGPTLGTPYFEARKIPCEMCSDIPCVAACPTGALDKSLKDISKSKMGVAVLVGHETCLNFLGLRCDICHRDCPLMGTAITLERSHNLRTGKHAMFIPTVHTEACTGCGKCEKSCPLEEAAIKVLPPKLALGVLGSHYRLGWEEKKKKGSALIEGTIDLPDRGYSPGEPVPPAPERNSQGGFKEFRP
ncbi:MAG: ferredoxin-type protein NapG [Alphaproteobacteria bacterium]|nr:ferredoxin-type protein NapG [Alphaproteobacteria bacterium]